MCHSYSDFNFGVTFLEHSVYYDRSLIKQQFYTHHICTRLASINSDYRMTIETLAARGQSLSHCVVLCQAVSGCPLRVHPKRRSSAKTTKTARLPSPMYLHCPASTRLSSSTQVNRSATRRILPRYQHLVSTLDVMLSLSKQLLCQLYMTQSCRM